MSLRLQRFKESGEMLRLFVGLAVFIAAFWWMADDLNTVGYLIYGGIYAFGLFIIGVALTDLLIRTVISNHVPKEWVQTNQWIAFNFKEVEAASRVNPHYTFRIKEDDGRRPKMTILTRDTETYRSDDDVIHVVEYEQRYRSPILEFLLGASANRRYDLFLPDSYYAS